MRNKNQEKKILGLYLWKVNEKEIPLAQTCDVKRLTKKQKNEIKDR